jgi:tripartite-type tricarboxylate transporter receptor subunit TctC
MRLIDLACSAVAVLGLATGPLALAQDTQNFPSKPVTFIVPFPAGGTSDVLARGIAQKLAAAWGQPVVVENRPGAAGNIGAAAVAKAPPDGHTLLLAAAAISAAPALYKDPGYKLFESLTPVTVAGTVPFMLVVHPSLPVRTTAEFIDHAKKNPGKLALGSGGNGTVPHLGGELLKMRTGIEFTHVPYKGGVQAMTDLVGGQIQFTIDGGSHVVSQIEAQKVRLVAVATAQRLAQYPNVPTIAESGVPGFEASAWQMLFVTGGTPKAVVDKIHAEVARALKANDMAERFQKMGIVVAPTTPAETAAFLRAEAARWAEVVRVSGAKVD